MIIERPGDGGNDDFNPSGFKPTYFGSGECGPSVNIKREYSVPELIAIKNFSKGYCSGIPNPDLIGESIQEDPYEKYRWYAKNPTGWWRVSLESMILSDKPERRAKAKNVVAGEKLTYQEISYFTKEVLEFLEGCGCERENSGRVERWKIPYESFYYGALLGGDGSPHRRYGAVYGVNVINNSKNIPTESRDGFTRDADGFWRAD